MHKINIAIIGLGFGECFAEIYAAHPDVGRLIVCDVQKELCLRLQKRLPGVRICDTFEDVLNDPTIDAVHIATPIPLHGEQSLRVLKSGKHCAAAVPMAIDLREAEAIAAAAKETNKTYMLMETSLYTSRFLHVQDLLRAGAFGRIQFLSGAHYQDMENWPPYWKGLPPMWYGTHAAAPLLALADSPAKSVYCMGSGTMDASLQAQYGNPYPVECALIEFENGIKAAVTRSLFETARQYSESFNLYGSEASFEWEQIEGEDPVLFRYTEKSATGLGKKTETRRITIPSFASRLPSPLQKFADGGHGGSHPFLVNEFISAILTGKPPRENENFSLRLTKLLLAAHDSALSHQIVCL